MQGELPYSLRKVNSRYFHLNRGKEREKNKQEYSQMKSMCPHTHTFDQQLYWGWVRGNEIVTDKEEVSRFF